MISWFKNKPTYKIAWVTFVDGEVKRCKYQEIQGVQMINWCGAWWRVGGGPNACAFMKSFVLEDSK
jgi:hypothetical protein